MRNGGGWQRVKLRVLLIAGLSGLAAFASAQDTKVSGGISFRLVSGTFGGTATMTIVYAPAVVRLETGRFELVGFLPYLSVQNGFGTLSDGRWIPMQGSVSGAPSVGTPMTGMMGPPSIQLTPSSASGIGDIVASAGYRVADNVLTGTQVVVSGRVKVPTASGSGGLGAGRTDVGGAATVRRRFDSGWIYGEVGYVVVGKPVGAGLKNAMTWSAGGGRRLMSRLFLLGSAFGNSAVLSGYEAPVEVGAGVGARLADDLYLTAIPSIGLTHASPKYGVTFGLITDLWRRW